MLFNSIFTLLRLIRIFFSLFSFSLSHFLLYQLNHLFDSSLFPDLSSLFFIKHYFAFAFTIFYLVLFYSNLFLSKVLCYLSYSGFLFCINFILMVSHLFQYFILLHFTYTLIVFSVSVFGICLFSILHHCYKTIVNLSVFTRLY